MSSSELQSLYQQVILDHSKHPHGKGALSGDTAASSCQINPTCGDEITLELHPGADGTFDRVSWDGSGCAISQASASLLAGLAEDWTPAVLRERIGQFREALRSRGAIEIDEELFEDAAALGGVSRYTARVKCAMLAWVAAEDALTRLDA
ncbi:Fe-S cluster assembly sulfur transfer protein SufU [Schumannella soli]|uniref:SUF system NifU family Fe-S cluster assembly protein n=1 Tax=Schumannella soli TaxID=2590779 RepID=A0A506XWM7_9MICO|nr:SUF system NifU family Fe-S cluster assembly protein [Schumannella soli]TPW77304.1 SUF system NifU family Fe-S cluster assembly protein [Schumannella soli]